MSCHALWISLIVADLPGWDVRNLMGGNPATSHNHCAVVVMEVCRISLEEHRTSYRAAELAMPSREVEGARAVHC